MSRYSTGMQLLVGGMFFVSGILMLLAMIFLFIVPYPEWAILTMVVAMALLGVGKLLIDSGLASSDLERYEGVHYSRDKSHNTLGAILTFIALIALILALILFPEFRERFGKTLIRLSD